MIILVIGPPGCGKGTLCRRLCEDPRFMHISTGDLLRKEAKTHEDLRKKLALGEYISDEYTTQLLLKEVSKDKLNLLDGYPRNKTQVKFLEEKVIKPTLVIHLNLEEDKSKERILGRKENREDDKIEILNERFRLYNELTRPVLEYYKEKGIVLEIDASKGKEEIYEEVKKKVDGVYKG